MITIDMQTMRYINLLDKASGVKTRKCFNYNNTIIFAVPRQLVSRALGANAVNLRRIQAELGRKIRVIAEADSSNEIGRFIAEIIYPVQFKDIAVENGIAIINAGSHSKAALIGRNKRRLEELEQIVRDTFGLGVKIV